MNKLRIIVSGVVVAAGLLIPATAAQASPASTAASPAGTVEGCPSGDVCIYPENTGWNNGQPSNFYYTYGCYNLVNQLGVHRVFNNQTGGAVVDLYTGYNCSGNLVTEGPAGDYADLDLTPINSIALRP
ncbi:MAG TPA: hypothetical protein VHX38_38235 [Pseudonocardiaceae bacterium]|jgi:hypothetical protein|nr:hypothetical protein [Pseudonocardiaceae bacterium]